MDKNSNIYTFTFSGILVLIVGALLASAATFLKPKQLQNANLEKMQDILMAIDIKVGADKADEAFRTYIKDQKVINSKGELQPDTIRAFDISLEAEQQKERRGEADQRLYPLFIGEKEGQKFYIVPMRGQGLWGPIWGFVALQDDFNTIYGANFSHKSETPGLGAEIAQSSFENQFRGKKIFDEEEKFVSVKVKKGGAEKDNLHEVDAISGGTITSNGVSEMLGNTLSHYLEFIKNEKTKPL